MPTPQELNELYDFAMRDYQSRIAEQQAHFARAHCDGDFSAQLEATQEMAALRAKMNAFQQMAVEEAQRMNPPPPQAPARGEGDLPTPDEVAGFCKIDAATYNRGVAKLLKLKAEGHYKE